MKYNLGQIELPISDEEILRQGMERDAIKPGKIQSYYFIRAKEAYKNFDFSQLDNFNKFEVDKVRTLFSQDPELSSRPLLFVMYILHRNGFLDDNYFKTRVFNLLDANLTSQRNLILPEGLITEKGILYGTGKDGHIWLYNFLNLQGVDTTDVVRYGTFDQSRASSEDCNAFISKRRQHFSKLKEFAGNADKLLYISDEQALAIDRLRKIYDVDTPLSKFLLTCTSDLGFGVNDSPRAFKVNFDTFAKNVPEAYLDRTQMFTEIRVAKQLAASREKRD